MLKKGLWILLVILAIFIGMSPFFFFWKNIPFRNLHDKASLLLTNSFYRIGLNMHIIFGAIALLIGWTQFSSKIRLNKLQIHRFIGKIYVIAAFMSSVFGVYAAYYATGGFISQFGFACLGCAWLGITLKAYLMIKKGEIIAHQNWMIYSYACCLAAVTLRLELPILTGLLGDYLTAYRAIAWLSWIPNLIVALWIIKQKKNIKRNTFLTQSQ